MQVRNQIHKTAIKFCKMANIRLSNLETLIAKSQTQSIPTHFEIDFLSECNLRCMMCHQAKYIMPHDKLTQQNLDAIIDQLPFVETVMIAGLGEPLLYKKIDEFLPFLSKYGCYSHMFTNGMLIDKRLESLKHLKKVSISFDGATKATFEYLRARSDFNKIVANIKKLHTHAPKLLLATSTVVSNKNVGEISGIVALAEECGIKEVHLSPVDHTPELSLGLKDYAIFNRQLADVSGSKVKIFNNINKFHFERVNSQVSDSDRIVVKQTFNNSTVSNVENSRLSLLTGKRYIHKLSPEEELKELKLRGRKMNEIAKNIEDEIKQGKLSTQIPACSALWKYGFFRSNNQVRLCPYADINVGDIQSTLTNSFNSDLIQLARKQFNNQELCLSVCENCNDDHRQFKQQELLAFQAKLTKRI